MQKSFERIILGLDPGTNIMGFGVIGIENKKAHTALADARATYELYKKLLAL